MLPNYLLKLFPSQVRTASKLCRIWTKFLVVCNIAIIALLVNHGRVNLKHIPECLKCMPYKLLFVIDCTFYFQVSTVNCITISGLKWTSLWCLCRSPRADASFWDWQDHIKKDHRAALGRIWWEFKRLIWIHHLDISRTVLEYVIKNCEDTNCEEKKLSKI